MSKTIDNIKCGNYEVVDNRGVYVTKHFTQCLEKEFADLEAKLAESESKVKEYANEITRRNTEQLDMQTRSFFKIRDLDTEILELKQQLAEKDKNALALFSALYDILEEQDPENVSSRIDYLTKQNNGTISDFYKEHKVLKQKLEEKDQDKISFVIAKLEKVKEHFINIKTPTLGVIRMAEMVMYIDNQIKQLKEGN